MFDSFVFLADTGTTVGWSDVSSIMSAITSQISVSTVVAVIAGALGISVGLAFMWWVARKGVRTLMSAFRKGKVSV